MWDLEWTKWHCSRFISERLEFLISLPFYRWPTLIRLSQDNRGNLQRHLITRLKLKMFLLKALQSKWTHFHRPYTTLLNRSVSSVTDSIFPRKCVKVLPGKRRLKYFCIINLLFSSNESIQPSCSKRTTPTGTHYCHIRQTDTWNMYVSEVLFTDAAYRVRGFPSQKDS
jgi:hypothetical protein